jgi:hypothetical protein
MDVITRLSEILAGAPVLLSAISGDEAAKQPAPGKWSKKQELGHLVDSACNNHQRIVRAQLESEPSLPGYEGDKWVALHAYQAMAWNEIIGSWRVMNEHLLRAAHSVSAQVAERRLTVAGKPMTLGFLLEEYVAHLVHHLQHIGVKVS